MKNIIIGLVAGIAIAVSGSAFASLKVMVSPLPSIPLLTVGEQINLGHKYNQYTGEKLEIIELSETEKRFRSIEARLIKLENK
jgi:hypothetical protein